MVIKSNLTECSWNEYIHYVELCTEVGKITRRWILCVHSIVCWRRSMKGIPLSETDMHTWITTAEDLVAMKNLESTVGKTPDQPRLKKRMCQGRQRKGFMACRVMLLQQSSCWMPTINIGQKTSGITQYTCS